MTDTDFTPTFKRDHAYETPAISIPIDPILLAASIDRFSLEAFAELKGFEASSLSKDSRLGQLPVEISLQIAEELREPDNFDFWTQLIKCASRDCEHGHSDGRLPELRYITGQVHGRHICGALEKCNDCSQHVRNERLFDTYFKMEYTQLLPPKRHLPGFDNSDYVELKVCCFLLPSTSVDSELTFLTS